MFDKQKIAKKIGSFWLDNMTPNARTQALALSTTMVEASNFEYSKLIGAYALNVAEMATGSFALRYTPTQVVHIKPNDDTFVLPGYLLNGGMCDRDSFHLSDTEEAWVVPTNMDLTVDAITIKDGTVWVSGIDFTGVPGAIVLFENPTLNFAYGVIPVKAGRLQAPGLLRGLHDLKRTPSGCGRFVAAYRGGNRTTRNMVRAAAEYAGYLVFQEDCKVLDTEREGNGYRYITDAGVYFAAYTHVPVLPGTYVRAGDVAGLEYQVFTAENYTPTCPSLQINPPAQGQLLQYLTGTVDGKTLPDAVGALTAPAVICDVPYVIFDDAGDKAEFTIPSSLNDIDDIKFSVTLRLRVVDEDTWDTIVVNEHEPMGAWLNGDGPTGATNGVDFGYYNYDTGDSIDWYIYAPDALLGQMVTFTFERKNNVVTYLLNGEPAEHTVEDGDPTLPFPAGVDFTISDGELNTALKHLYFNLGGYEAEFNCEEGAGSILFNSKDSSANAFITSTSGLGVMRAGVLDGVVSHNAKNGCSKVSGTYFHEAPDAEFVYIPADENGIAADPTMVPNVKVTNLATGQVFTDLNLHEVYNAHPAFENWGSQGLIFINSVWQFYDDVAGPSYNFTTAPTNFYPPRGIYTGVDGIDGSRQFLIEYTHPNIDDEGNIITPNLNCLPGKVHNGANYNVMQTAASAEFPAGSRWFTGTTAARLTRAGITDASLTADFAARTLQVGAHNSCQVEATTQYVENTFAGMSQEDMDAVRVFMGSPVCNSDAAQIFNWWEPLISEIPHDYLLDMFCSKKGIRAYTNNTAKLLRHDLFSIYWVYDYSPLIGDRMRDLNKLVALYETDNPDKTTLYTELGPKAYTSSFNMFFEYVLGECAIVVKLKTGNTTLNDRMVDFFKEERPASKYVITIGNVGA